MKMAINKDLQRHWIDTRLKLKKSKIHGNGIFANDFIKEGEILMVWGGELFTIQDVKEGKAKLDSLTGYGEGLYLGRSTSEQDTLDQFLNHSCNPNLWMLNEITITAARNIYIGDELTADYAMWELDDSWIMPLSCQCGSSNCRKNITGSDWRLKILQEKYKNHFLPCINERIKKLTPQYKLAH